MERLREKKGMIFDLDGTLFDSMGIWAEIDEQFLRKRGFDLPEDYIDVIKTMEFYQAAVYTIKRFGLDETPEALMQEWTDMAEDAYAHEVGLKQHARRYLDQLCADGKRLGVSTAAPEHFSIPALKNNRIDALFAAFTSTSEVGEGKHSPAVYLKTAEKLGLKPSECVVFEDTLAGICTAKRGGFLTVAVYDASARAQAEQIRREADIYIESFAELLAEQAG